MHGEMREGRSRTASAALPLYENRRSLLLGHQDRQGSHGSDKIYLLKHSQVIFSLLMECRAKVKAIMGRAFQFEFSFDKSFEYV